jgi:hypothetical protein
MEKDQQVLLDDERKDPVLAAALALLLLFCWLLAHYAHALPLPVLHTLESLPQLCEAVYRIQKQKEEEDELKQNQDEGN